jgi:LysR family transcriptional regulator, transcription activator of glutamate synthase operon
MDAAQLRWFVLVAEREHVTAAASELHVSQPALSRALARLEAELGVPLFDRQGRSIRLNRYGTLFRPHAERALAELDAGRRGLADATAVDRGTVAMAFLYTLGTWLVPKLLRMYRAERPDVDFRLQEGSARAMLESLASGEVDLILTSPHPPGGEHGWAPLLAEELLLVVPPEHRLARRRRVRLRDVADEPFVTVRSGTGLRALTEELCSHAGFRPRVVLESEDPATVRGLVAAGLGVALVPPLYGGEAELAPAVGHLAIRDVDATRTIGLAWSSERYRSPATEAFREFVVQAARHRPGELR